MVHSEIASSEEKITAETASKISQSADEIKSTVYTKSEVNDLLGEKADSDDVYTKTETVSQITQSADEIKALVSSEVETLDGRISSNASSITQNADSIASLTTSVDRLDGVVSEQAASIKQNADGITAAVSRIDTIDSNVKQNTASIEVNEKSINSVVSSLNGKAEDSGFTALTGLASSIVQTNNSITSVVTELNKAPEDCKYSAITQLQDGIDLCVKDEDLNGDEIVSRINLSDGTVTIAGEKIHITGDTTFDGNVIIGGYIANDAIGSDHLKANSVTAYKIAANAITADKIQAGAITVDKITDKSITSTKIEDGAITTTKLENGAVSSTKIEGGAITTEHIQAGSITGEHISAGAVTAEKLATETIELSGDLQIVGGTVTLSEDGLKVTRSNGSYTVFDAIGINYFDKNSVKHATVSRMMVGTAKHNDYVRFDSPWDIVPSVIVIPMTIKTGVENYTTEQLSVNYYATDITNEGFRVKAYTIVDTLKGLQTFYEDIAVSSTTNTQRGELTVKDIPPLATQADIKLKFFRSGYSGGSGMMRGYAGVSAVVYLNDEVIESIDLTNDIRTAENLTVGSMSAGTFTRSDVLVVRVTFKQGDTIKITAYARKMTGDGGYSTCTLTSIDYNTDDYDVIATGTASFIVSDSISSAYSIEKGS